MNQQAATISVVRPMFLALLAGLALAFSLVAATYLVDGASLATRSATDLSMPIGVTWLGMFSATILCALRGHRLAAALCVAGFVLLGITANRYVAASFIEAVEMPEQPIQATRQHPYRSVIVLGGGGGITRQETKELNRDGERIFSAAQLWHAGLVASIICTGSSPRDDAHPCEISAALLESVGVTPEAIYQVHGENTAQEMRALKEFLADLPSGFPDAGEINAAEINAGEIGLITSAFHMPRAMRLAATQQLDFQPLPCRYQATDLISGLGPRDLIPNAAAAAVFGTALKESLAGLVGR